MHNAQGTIHNSQFTIHYYLIEPIAKDNFLVNLIKLVIN